MPPKRLRCRSSTMDHEVLAGTQLGQMELGTYQQKMSGSEGHNVSDLLVWHQSLAAMIAVVPSGVVHWTSIKEAMLLLYDRVPRFDPFLKDRSFTNVTSAEWVARCIRVMLSHVRRMRLSEDRLAQGLQKCRSESERQQLQALVQSVDTAPSQAPAQAPAQRELVPRISIGSSCDTIPDIKLSQGGSDISMSQEAMTSDMIVQRHDASRSEEAELAAAGLFRPRTKRDLRKRPAASWASELPEGWHIVSKVLRK